MLRNLPIVTQRGDDQAGIQTQQNGSGAHAPFNVPLKHPFFFFFFFKGFAPISAHLGGLPRFHPIFF